jgi:hypothetical protein
MLGSSPKLPSERRFGFTFAAGLAILGLRGILGHWSRITYSACFLSSIVCILLTLTSPQVLAPLNRALFYLGLQTAKIVSPILLGIIFFGILTPISIVTRLFGRDELRLKLRAASSYWIDRDPSGAAAHSFRNQF